MKNTLGCYLATKEHGRKKKITKEDLTIYLSCKSVNRYMKDTAQSAALYSMQEHERVCD